MPRRAGAWEQGIPAIDERVAGLMGVGTPAYLGGVGGIALAVGHRGGSGERNAIATGRLVSSLHSGAADNFLAAVAEIDAADRWKAVAIMLAGDIASLACETHGEDAQK